MELLDNFINNLDYLKTELPLLLTLKEQLKEYLSRYQRPDDSIVSFYSSLNEEDLKLKQDEIDKLQIILDKYSNSDFPLFITLYKESEILKEIVTNITNTAESLYRLENDLHMESEFLENMKNFFLDINFKFINTTLYQYYDNAITEVTVCDCELIPTETVNILVIDKYGYEEKDIKKKIFLENSDEYISYITLNGRISYERNFSYLKGKRVNILGIIKK